MTKCVFCKEKLIDKGICCTDCYHQWASTISYNKPTIERLDKKIDYLQNQIDKGWVGLNPILELLKEIKNGK